MAYLTQSSFAFFAFALCISLHILPPVYCAIAGFPDGDELVRITDSRLHFNPSVNNTAAWTPFDDTATNRHAIQTSNEQATISLAFRGTRLSLLVFVNSYLSDVLVTLDNRNFTISPYFERNVVTLPNDGTYLDGSVNHNFTIKRAPDAASGSTWSLSALSFTAPSASPVSAGPTSRSGTTPTASFISQPSQSRGFIVGMSFIAALFVGLVVLGSVLLCRWRRRRLLLPSPYDATSEQPQLQLVQLYRPIRISSRRVQGSRRESNRATLATSVNDIRLMWHDAARDRDLATDRRDEMENGLELSSFIVDEDPFRDSGLNTVSIGHRSRNSAADIQEASISRPSTLPSITPPPSYHTEDS